MTGNGVFRPGIRRLRSTTGADCRMPAAAEGPIDFAPGSMYRLRGWLDRSSFVWQSPGQSSLCKHHPPPGFAVSGRAFPPTTIHTRGLVPATCETRRWKCLEHVRARMPLLNPTLEPGCHVPEESATTQRPGCQLHRRNARVSFRRENITTKPTESGVLSDIFTAVRTPLDALTYILHTPTHPLAGSGRTPYHRHTALPCC